MTETADAGGLSIDQAVGLLEPAEETAPESEAVETPEGEAEPEPDPSPEGEPETPDEPVEGEPEPEPEVEPEVEPVDPPQFWGADDKAAFEALPPEAQALALKYEQNREASFRRSLQQAAQVRNEADAARKALEAETQGVKTLLAEVSEAVTQARLAFDRPLEDVKDPDGKPLRWSDIDWNATFRADPAFAATLKARFDFEQAELQRVQTAEQKARQTAEQAAFQTYVQEQASELQARAPELATDQAKRKAIGEYLVSQGYPAAQLKGIGALDLITAHKAMLYDQAQASARARVSAPVVRTPPKATARPVRPAAVEASSPTKRAADVANHRFAQTKSIDDAVAFLNARG